MSNGPLKITVMKLLSEETLSGYALMKALSEKTGWKPSPGSIYPLLAELNKKKFITSKQHGREKCYYLTLQGNKMLQELSAKKNAFHKDMESHLRIMAMLGEEKEAEDMKMILRIMSEKQGHLSWIHEEAVLLRRCVFQLAEKNLTTSEQKKVKIILKKTAQELRKFL